MPILRSPAYRAPGSGAPVPTPWSEVLVGKLTGDSTGGAFSVAELTAEPGWSRPAYVQHRLDECFYVAAGSFTASVETETVSSARKRSAFLAQKLSAPPV